MGVPFATRRQTAYNRPLDHWSLAFCGRYVYGPTVSNPGADGHGREQDAQPFTAHLVIDIAVVAVNRAYSLHLSRKGSGVSGGATRNLRLPFFQPVSACVPISRLGAWIDKALDIVEITTADARDVGHAPIREGAFRYCDFNR